MTADLLRNLLTASLTGSLAILLVLALRVPVRRWFGAQASYALWALVPATLLMGLLPAPTKPMLRTIIGFGDVPADTAAAASGVAESLLTAVAPDLSLLLAALWLVGGVSTAAAFARQQRRYRQSLGRLHPLGPAFGPEVLRSAATEHGPALIGALRPRIVLPADFDRRYDARERELVLAHERVHLTRWDTRINAFVTLLRCLNWFNPLLHFAAAKLRFDQELACDAAVIARFPEARRPYADAMLKTQLAEQRWQELPLPAGCHWSAVHPLKERILMLKHPLPTPLRRSAGWLFAAALCAAGSYVAWQAQPAHAAPQQTAGAYTGIGFSVHIAGHDPSQTIEFDTTGVSLNTDTATAIPRTPELKDDEAASLPTVMPRLYATADQNFGYAQTIERSEIDSQAEFVPAARVSQFYQEYGKPAHIRYGTPDDRREIALTATPDGDATRVRIEFTRRGQAAQPVELTVADGKSFDLKSAAGQVRAVLDGLDDVSFTLERARTSELAETIPWNDVSVTPAAPLN